MSHVFPRHTKVDLPTVARAEGCYFYDTQGKQYFDGSGGAAVSCLGHGDKEVLDAIKIQLDKSAYAHNGFFTSESAEALAEYLIERAPKDIDRAYFVSGGSEAVETAIKLARQYYLEIGQESRHKVIARRQSYHGNTLAALISEADLVVPVALHPTRFRQRKFNQAAELSRYICKLSNRPYAPHILKRHKNTKQQIGLNEAERQRNLSGAFSIYENQKFEISGRNILLVDDVYTTGATAKAAARTLNRAGAKSVDVLVFAKVENNAAPNYMSEMKLHD